MAETLKSSLLRHLEELLKIPTADRLKQRYARYRSFGHFLEKQLVATPQLAKA